jgi:hypothetical protein
MCASSSSSSSSSSSDSKDGNVREIREIDHKIDVSAGEEEERGQEDGEPEGAAEQLP